MDFRALAVVVVALALPGCATTPPPEHTMGAVPASSAPSRFDVSWQAARGAADDEGVHVTLEDRARGIVQGDKGSLSVLITVTPQAGGSVRVEFNVTGPASSQDAGLQDRLTRAYQRRMGRG